jgi:hypothetical protein
VERINDEAIVATVEKVKDALWNLEDKRVALLVCPSSRRPTTFASRRRSRSQGS